MKKPIVLIVRDGWGVNPEKEGNAVAAASTPNMDFYRENYPHCMIGTSGVDVGLPKGQMGSSEVGHLNMGAGRIVKQEVVRIDEVIESGELFDNPLILKAIENCKKNESALHLMGLVQDQGVHAMNTHLYALLQFAANQGIKKVFVHFFADGRDTPPQSALTFLKELEKKIEQIGVGQIASVSGRFWAMDRDRNWDRVKVAYEALIHGAGLTAGSARKAIENAYSRIEQQKAEYESNPDGIIETDEFIRPTLIVDNDDQPIGTISQSDSVIHFNYRQDRAVELTRVFFDDDFPFFERVALPDIFYLGLTRYYDDFTNAVIPPMNMDKILAEVLCKNSIRQLRISETQKFRHVTSFFNSKIEEPFCLEDRILVKSHKISEDKQPAMRADELSDLVMTAISNGVVYAREKAQTAPGVVLTLAHGDEQSAPEGGYDVIVLNYPNCDMVGHRGFFDPAVKAVEAVDKNVGKVVKAVLEADGIALITADHGNVEQMVDPETGKPMTAHTTFDVELFYVSNDQSNVKLVDRGILSDIAPTILSLLEIDKPEPMNRPTLFVK